MSKFSLKDETLKSAEKQEHDFIIGKDTNKKGKVFTSFTNIDEFLLFNNSQDKINRNFYECIRNERCEYYDIDEPKKPINAEYWKDRTLNEIVNDFVNERQNWIEATDFNNKNLDIEKDLYVLVSEKPEEKKSIHIIIRNGFIFKNLQEHKEYINDFKSYLTTLSYGFEIDYSVYSKDRLLRVLGSCKKDSDRYLIRSNYNKLSLECDERLFYTTYMGKYMDNAMEYSGLSCDGSIIAKEIIRGYIPKVKGFKIKEEFIEYNTDETDLDEDFIIKLFDAIHIKRWDDYNTHMYLIYLGKKLGLSDKQIHTYCKKSEKYDYKWVQGIINTRKERCDFTIEMVYRYLQRDYPKNIWDKIIPPDTRFEDYKAISKNKRTEEQQKYIDNIIDKLNKKSIGCLFKKPTHSKYVNVVNRSENIKYVEDLNTLFKYGRSIAIKSCMGSGKTTSCIKYISSLSKYSRIVIVSPRITFSNAITQEYNDGLRKLGVEELFTCYLDVERKRDMRRINRVVVSMESLHHLTEIYDPDLVVIDECQANLCSHISNTNGKNLDNNLYVFKEFIKSNNSKVIWADAFLNEKTLQFINDLEIKTTLYVYNRKMEERIVYKIPDIHSDVSSAIRKIKNQKLREEYRITSSNWYKLLIRKLEEGKKVYFPCTTRSKVEIVERLFNERYGETKKGLFYVGRKKGEKQYDFSNINESWTDCDLVMTTTTISVGLNYDVKNHFNCIIMYFSNRANNLIVDMFQSHYRVRHIKDLELYYYESSYYDNVRSKEDINIKLVQKEKWYNDIYAGFQEKAEKYIKNLVINDIYERELCRGLMNPLIERFLLECNYTFKEYDNPLEPDFIDDEEEEEEEKDDIETIIKEYENIQRIDGLDYHQLQEESYRRKLTDEENKQIQKYFFVNFFVHHIDTECVITSKQVQGIFWYYTNQKYKGVMKKLSSIRIDKEIDKGNKDVKELLEKQSDIHGQSLLHKDTIMQIELTREIIKGLGLNHINDTQTEVKDDIIRDVYESWKDKYNEISTTMNLRTKKKKDGDIKYKTFLELLKSMLGNSPASMCKFEKTKNKRIKKDGKISVKQTYNMVFKEPIIKNLLEKNPSLKLRMENIPIHIYNMLGFKKVEPKLKSLMKKRKRKNTG